ncbi:cytochrome P450, partial [Trifolium medium]|nr:cytochrome P450 [Trifolium medium]
VDAQMSAHLTPEENIGMDDKAISVIIMCSKTRCCEKYQERRGQSPTPLCALPWSFENFKDIMLYGKECTVTMEEVQTTLRTNELTKFKDMKVDNSGEGSNVSWGEE